MPEVVILRKLGVVDVVYKGEDDVFFAVHKPNGEVDIYLPKDSSDVSNYSSYNYSNYVHGGLTVFERNGMKFISFDVNPAQVYHVEVHSKSLNNNYVVNT